MEKTYCVVFDKVDNKLLLVNVRDAALRDSIVAKYAVVAARTMPACVRTVEAVFGKSGWNDRRWRYERLTLETIRSLCPHTKQRVEISKNLVPKLTLL